MLLYEVDGAVHSQAMTGVVIINQKGVQARDQQGRFAHRIIPPAKAITTMPQSVPKDTSGVVHVEQTPRPKEGNTSVSRPAEPARYRVIGPSK